MTQRPGEAAATIEEVCEVMHDAYEQAARGAGWETNFASRRPWAGVPEANKATMRAAVAAAYPVVAASVLRSAAAVLDEGGDRRAAQVLERLANETEAQR